MIDGLRYLLWGLFAAELILLWVFGWIILMEKVQQRNHSWRQKRRS